ncbi:MULTISPECIES: DUF1367 family protein [Serratia]|uniref:DUF1367 family protein n=1 Tax=Serratia ureilytica TaxID=300181 RepID=A0A9X9G0B9_9GAMM|nr:MULTISPECIES: DUF1367 family protein [Serratia]APS35510.1 bacteriophage protein [Serratia marcescens]MBH3246113.1 DUF1367 family protein [Serratia marcescens]OHT35550.1 hypothetical protein BGV45_08375 [Serratia marcescens]OHT37270.1 hypothetical protein BGV46_08365 [Serratia marcescens]TXE22828.1 DUF1367 family protein [Serratia ureilytica]
MAQLIQLVKSAPTILTPATIEASDFVQRVKLGEWIQAEFRRVRNYQYHKRFFKLLQFGFDYWTPTGGALTLPERELIDGFVGYLVEMSGQQHGEVITAVADEYLLKVGQLRTQEIALLKSFEPYRAWATVEAGYYYEVVLPNGLRQRIPQSISFSKMDEDTFQSLYKAVFNVLWNFILFRKFNSQREAENVAMQLLEFA